MSTPNADRVLALQRKAFELEHKGHLQRSSEIYGRAAEASRALDSGPDNLVAVDMQTRQAGTLIAFAEAAGVDQWSGLAAQRTEIVALLSAAVAELERRRVAETLLEGKCTAAEEAWFAVEWRDAGCSAADAAHRAKLVGYSTFLRAGLFILGLFDIAAFFEAECSASQFQAFAQHVVHAADLMQLPHSHGTAGDRGRLTAEISFADCLSIVMKDDDSGAPYLHGRGMDARLVQTLTTAWQRLQRSGVLTTRGILDQLRRDGTTTSDKFNAAVAGAMAAPGLRSCALAGCGAKEAHPQHFKSCSACRTVVYCRKEHQVEGWPSHKKACKAAAKAAAPDGGGAGSGAA